MAEEKTDFASIKQLWDLQDVSVDVIEKFHILTAKLRLGEGMAGVVLLKDYSSVLRILLGELPGINASVSLHRTSEYVLSTTGGTVAKYVNLFVALLNRRVPCVEIATILYNVLQLDIIREIKRRIIYNSDVSDKELRRVKFEHINIDALEWIFERTDHVEHETNTLFLYACETGNLAIAKYVYSLGVTCSIQTVFNAIMSVDNIRVMEWLYKVTPNLQFNKSSYVKSIRRDKTLTDNVNLYLAMNWFEILNTLYDSNILHINRMKFFEFMQKLDEKTNMDNAISSD